VSRAGGFAQACSDIQLALVDAINTPPTDWELSAECLATNGQVPGVAGQDLDFCVGNNNGHLQPGRK
jgi:hypothetical protein